VGIVARGGPDRAYGIDTEDAVTLFVEAVEAHLVRDIEQDQNAAGHADGKASDVDKGVSLVFLKVPEGDDQIISEHGLLPM
jgi:hypothetical protein